MRMTVRIDSKTKYYLDKPELSGNRKGNHHNDNKIKLKTLIIDGEKYRTFFNRKFANRKKWIKPDSKSIVSFIPCTIIKVFAKEGQKATRNKEMAVIEAMKMQNTIYFPGTGIVKHVNIKTGDKIPKGFVMVEYE
jgi:biotin carboxyl carrier protein